VGSTLTAGPGAWDLGVSLAYQWKHEGIDIPGATSATYRVQNAYAGQALTVVVVATKPGYSTVSRESRSTQMVYGGTLASTPTPQVVGSAGIGSTLTVQPGAWEDGVILTYQWGAAGRNITGATRATYTIQAGDFGQEISVAVTASMPGYTPITVLSPSTQKVALAGLIPTLSAPVRTADGFTVNVTNYNPAYTFTPSMISGGGTVRVGLVSAGQLPLTITGLAPGAQATVQVVASRAGYASGTGTKLGQALMGAAYTPTFSTPVPTADGFKVNITNYNPAYSFTPTVVAGDGTVTAGVASGSVLPLTVTGMTAGASRVSVATSRTNYTPGVAEVRSPALPVIQALSVSGSVSKGTSITITGTNLVGASVVSIGGVAAPKFTVTSPTTIVVGVWNGAVSGPVRVTTGGGVAVSAGSLTVTAALTAPTLAAVSPLSVTSGGKGQTVVVTGTNLGSVTQVMRGTVTVPFQVLSATKLLLTIPAGAATGAFTITTAGGIVSTASFTVTASPVAPVFTGPAVTAKAGTVLTLSGVNIGAISAITWAGASFATYWVTDAGTVQVYVPAVAAPGTGSLVLTTPGGTATISLTVTG
jgi:hypothetical protein